MIAIKSDHITNSLMIFKQYLFVLNIFLIKFAANFEQRLF